MVTNPKTENAKTDLLFILEDKEGSGESAPSSPSLCGTYVNWNMLHYSNYKAKLLQMCLLQSWCQTNNTKRALNKMPCDNKGNMSLFVPDKNT